MNGLCMGYRSVRQSRKTQICTVLSGYWGNWGNPSERLEAGVPSRWVGLMMSDQSKF